MKASIRWVGVLLVLGSVGTTWLSGSGRVPTYTGYRLPGVRWMLFAILVAHVLGANLQARESGAWLVRAVACMEIMLASLALLVLEAAPGLVPGGIVVRTVRRSAVNVGSGPGPWLLAAGALLALAAPHAREQLELRAIRVGPLLELVAAAGVETLLISLRTPTWVTGKTPEGAVSLQGRDLPWLGPLTLLLAFAFPIAAGTRLLTRRWMPLLVPAALCWVCGFAACVVIAVAGDARHIRISGVGRSVELGSPLRWAPCLYVATCISAAIGIAVSIAIAD